MLVHPGINCQNLTFYLCGRDQGTHVATPVQDKSCMTLVLAVLVLACSQTSSQGTCTLRQKCFQLSGNHSHHFHNFVYKTISCYKELLIASIPTLWAWDVLYSALGHLIWASTSLQSMHTSFVYWTAKVKV